MPPDTAERRPRRGGVPDESLAGDVKASLAVAAVKRSVPHRRAPKAYVSLYLPSGRRRWHWYAYRCRQCGRYQFGRSLRIEDVEGPRMAGCGHMVTVEVARIYGSPVTR
jgi:hypothetical protein